MRISWQKTHQLYGNDKPSLSIGKITGLTQFTFVTDWVASVVDIVKLIRNVLTRSR